MNDEKIEFIKKLYQEYIENSWFLDSLLEENGYDESYRKELWIKLDLMEEEYNNILKENNNYTYDLREFMNDAGDMYE